MFNGVRLTIARQRRSLTKKELAERIGLEPRSISGFEAGQYTPTDENVDRIARVLYFPNDFFLGDEIDVPSETGVSFRSMSKMSARQRDAAIAASSLAFLMSDWVEEKFNLPDADLLDLREDSPEIAALTLRQHWGLGELPVKNMIHTLEAKGVRVFSLMENCREVDAYSLWRNGRSYIFLNTGKSAERRRYDAAHELGHLVLHKHAAPNGINAEKQADAFAGTFLMPTASLKAYGRVTPSFEALIKIKKKWTVSLAATVFRLHEIGLISDWHYHSLFKEMSMRGWRIKEPFPARPEISRLWEKVFASLRETNIGISDIIADLKVPEEELVKLVFGLVTIGLPSSGASTSTRGQRPRLNVVK